MPLNLRPSRKRKQTDGHEGTDAPTSLLDLSLLRQAITLSAESRYKGHHPFAALVADENGKLIAAAGNNSMPPQGDPTQHAELAAVALAARALPPERLARCTLSSSAKPCSKCAGAICCATSAASFLACPNTGCLS